MLNRYIFYDDCNKTKQKLPCSVFFAMSYSIRIMSSPVEWICWKKNLKIYRAKKSKLNLWLFEAIGKRANTKAAHSPGNSTAPIYNMYSFFVFRDIKKKCTLPFYLCLRLWTTKWIPMQGMLFVWISLLFTHPVAVVFLLFIHSGFFFIIASNRRGFGVPCFFCGLLLNDYKYPSQHKHPQQEKKKDTMATATKQKRARMGFHFFTTLHLYHGDNNNDQLNRDLMWGQSTYGKYDRWSKYTDSLCSSLRRWCWLLLLLLFKDDLIIVCVNRCIEIAFRIR